MTAGRSRRASGLAWIGLAALLAALAVVPIGSQSPGPSRIVSLVPAVTEMLFAIDAGSSVVGVSSFDAYPPAVESLPKVGALIDPDFERILTLRPDLAVVYGTQDEFIGRLERVGIDVFRYRHADLADVTDTLRELGERVGRAEEASRLGDRIEADLAAVRASVALEPRPRTALLFGRESGTLRAIYASAGIGFLHDLLEVAGGDDVFADVARQSFQASVEVLLARSPDVILEIRPTAGWTTDRIRSEREVWLDLPALPAVRAGRVHMLADDRLFIPGPRVAEAARLMAEVLHPEVDQGNQEAGFP